MDSKHPTTISFVAGGILARGTFDLALISLITTPASLGSSHAINVLRSVLNYEHYCDAQLDAASDRAGSSFDRSRRMSAFASVQRRLVDKVVFVPLYRIDGVWAYAD